MSQEHIRALLQKRAVPYQTDGGTRLVFRGGSCTISYGDAAVVLPQSEYQAVARILGVTHELRQMPEKGRTR